MAPWNLLKNMQYQSFKLVGDATLRVPRLFKPDRETAALSTCAAVMGRGPRLRDFTMKEPYQDYSHANTFVDHDWWTPRPRTHKWAKWWMRKDWMKRRNVEQTYFERMNIDAMKTSSVLPQVFRHKLSQQLGEMTHSHVDPLTSLHPYCMLTGRKRGLVGDFRVSRIMLRRLADHAQLAGVTRAYWGQPHYPTGPPSRQRPKKFWQFHRIPPPYASQTDKNLCIIDPVFQDPNCNIKLCGKLRKIRKPKLKR